MIPEIMWDMISSGILSTRKEYRPTHNLLLLDKQISRYDGVKSDRNNNGQTISTLFVH